MANKNEKSYYNHNKLCNGMHSIKANSAKTIHKLEIMKKFRKRDIFKPINIKLGWDEFSSSV